MKIVAIGGTAAVLLGSSAATAAETITYTYDALGRLVVSTVTAGTNTGLNRSLTFDGAGNRVSLTVTGSTNPGSKPATVIVLPINGLTVIPIPNPNN